MSHSVQPHGQKPSRLPRPWDSPGKSPGMGCNFLLQCMKVKSESEVSQSCLTLSDPMDCSPPGSSVHGIFQALCPINSISDEFLELIPLLYSHTPLLPTSFPVSFSTLFNFFFYIPPYYHN